MGQRLFASERRHTRRQKRAPGGNDAQEPGTGGLRTATGEARARLRGTSGVGDTQSATPP